MHEGFLQLAIDEASRSITQGGGQFGAVIVRDGHVLATGQNRVTLSHDPTAHAEGVAIRAACSAIADHRLNGAVLYASTEPCPLCLSAAHWARIDRVYFAASRHDAARAGFSDAEIYEQLTLPLKERSLPVERIEMPTAQAPLDAWITLADKIEY